MSVMEAVDVGLVHETVDSMQLHASLQDQLEEQIGEVIYHCHICMEAFVCENVFQIHMDNHTAERPFECKVCFIRFIDEVHLQKHSEAKHKKQDTYEACEVCGKLFHDKVILRSHMAVHSEERRYGCNLCGKRFKRKSEMESHSVTHTGLKPFKCPMCSRAFTQRYSLKTHMRTHTGEKPFKCSICGKEFNRSSTVTLHMRQHTGAKPYQCPECKEAFKLLRDLKRHLAKVHGKENKPKFRTVPKKRGRKPKATTAKNAAKDKGKYECAICREEFNYATQFNDHIKMHDVDSCYLCGQELRSKTEKRRHVTRPIVMKNCECATCGVKFVKIDEFKKHLSRHSEECRLKECLLNAEKWQLDSKKKKGTKRSKIKVECASEEEDNSEAADDVNSMDDENPPKQNSKNISSFHIEEKHSIGGDLLTLKQERIDDEDGPDTTVLVLDKLGDGFQLKTNHENAPSRRPIKLKTLTGHTDDAKSPLSVVDSQKTTKGRPRKPYRVARVSPPRTRRSAKVRFKEPLNDECDKTTASGINKDAASPVKEPSNTDEDDEDDEDLDVPETYSTYVRHILRLQPVDKMMALIKAINKTVGEFIND